MAKVLVIGSGGREHALAWKFAQSPQVDQVYAAPGNPGMAQVAQCVDLAADDVDGLIRFVRQQHIDLTFVGPEVPLCAGIQDAFAAAGLTLFGPSKAAARLEGSKMFAKDMMSRTGIPTAAYASFSDYRQASAYLQRQPMPVVLKADGLAAGKGVIIAQTQQQAQQALKEMMCDGLFDQAGASVVIEEYLEGEEFSLLSFVHGETVIPMEIAQDHKRAYDHDEGLNTGGMGAYTPVSHLSQSVVQEAVERIVRPMASAMVKEGCPFTGVLYAGCMATAQGVKTIEFNVRFGDPECEVLMVSLQDDLYQICQDVLAHREVTLHWSKDPVLGVVMASKGYPESSTKGAVITGLDEAKGIVFHMGTSVRDGQLVTNGGRVLMVTAQAPTLLQAQQKAYAAVNKIHCDSLFWRTDIGRRGIADKVDKNGKQE